MKSLRITELNTSGELKKFNANQPRVPAGNPRGGEFRSSGGGGGANLSTSEKNAVSVLQGSAGSGKYAVFVDSKGRRTYVNNNGAGEATSGIRVSDKTFSSLVNKGILKKEGQEKKFDINWTVYKLKS